MDIAEFSAAMVSIACKPSKAAGGCPAARRPSAIAAGRMHKAAHHDAEDQGQQAWAGDFAEAVRHCPGAEPAPWQRRKRQRATSAAPTRARIGVRQNCHFKRRGSGARNGQPRADGKVDQQREHKRKPPAHPAQSARHGDRSSWHGKILMFYPSCRLPAVKPKYGTAQGETVVTDPKGELFTDLSEF